MDEPKKEVQDEPEATESSVVTDHEETSVPVAVAPVAETPEIPEAPATEPSVVGEPAPEEGAADIVAAPATAKRFLVAYVTSIFSALSLLFGAAWLGYVVFDYFISPKKSDSSFYFDLAPLYISLMASMTVFALLYFFSSQYVTRSVKRDTIEPRDWRVYKVIYAFFTAILLVTGASVVASFLYIPLAQAMVADDLTGHQITVQLLGGVHVLVWVGLLIWQERLVKKGKNGWLPSVIVLLLAAAIIVLTGIFPIGSKTNERYDGKQSSDLSTLETLISTYKADHNSKLPSSLSDLTFEADSPIKNRLSRYTYKKQATDYPAQPFRVQAQVGTDDDSDYNDYYDTYPDIDSPTETYQLCATFRTDTSSSEGSSIIPMFGGGTSSSSTVAFTKHKAGYVCFDRD